MCEACLEQLGYHAGAQQHKSDPCTVSDSKKFYIGEDFYVVMLAQKEVADLVCHLA